MKRLLVLSTLAASVVFAQRVTSPTGFGRSLYPGTGGPTAGPGRGLGAGGAGFGRVIFPGTGAPALVRPFVGPAFTSPPLVSHGVHNRSVLVPFPVFYGGGYYDAYEPPPAATPLNEYDLYGANQRAPVVIINQNFKPDTVNPVLRDYSDVPLPEAAPRAPAPANSPNAADTRDPGDQPTIYLIAMTDGTVFEAIAYWLVGDTLNYITVDGSHNRATLDLVDREFSKRLNDERNVEFKLPRR
jgi:hypothetical protein